ncbi:MAG: L,D-transpeptidase, partial [Candidatus Levyibacteriota bacterium]
MPAKKRKKTASSRASGRRFLSNLFLLLLALAALLVTTVIVKNITGEPLACANSISCINDLSGNYKEGKTGTFLGRSVSPLAYLADSSAGTQVLGTATGEKHIFVDLSTQTLKAYEGDKLIYTFPVSTGKWGVTPTGDFRIWVKLRYTRMEGGSGNTYYNLPNVPYTMFYHNSEVSKSRGYSIHGAYWHNNFGYPMSHGCINMRPEDAGVLFAWAQPVTDGHTTYESKDDPGTLVT